MSNETSYWRRGARSRLSRRRVLQSGAALGAAATAFGLLGCGGDGGEEQGDAAGKLYQPADTSARAAKGGVYQGATNDDVSSFDSITGVAQDVIHSNRVYSRIVKYQAYKYPEPIQAAVAPDAAISWEASPDGLQVTYKVRPNFKYDPRPPTNGRAMTAQDMKFSVDRFLRASPNRTNLANAVNPASPVTGSEAPDASTFVLKLAFPYSPINLFMGYSRYITVLPVEAESQFDVRQTMRGTGAWRLGEDVRSARISFTRNPEWYDAGKVNLDGINYAVIKDTSATLAQFRAGNIWTTAVPQEEVLSTKQGVPELLMAAQEEFSANAQYIRFGYNQGSPFRDDRVRKALSMLIDRDLFIATFGNVEAFESAGLSVPARWNSHISAGEEGFWLDPKDSKAFGENAKWFQYDPAEAKKLLRAAGYNGALESKWTYSVGLYPQIEDRRNEVLHSMWEQHGDFKLAINTVDYRNDFQPNYANNYDKHDGISTAIAVARPEVDNFLTEYIQSNQPRSGHVDANGQADAYLDDLINKQRSEQDLKRRISLVHDIQKHLASKMYLLLGPGQSLGFDLAWPWLGNWRVFRSKAGGAADQEGNIYYWYDQSKKKA